jgi:hypothetical protein
MRNIYNILSISELLKMSKEKFLSMHGLGPKNLAYTNAAIRRCMKEDNPKARLVKAWKKSWWFKH